MATLFVRNFQDKNYGIFNTKNKLILILDIGATDEVTCKEENFNY